VTWSNIFQHPSATMKTVLLFAVVSSLSLCSAGAEPIFDQADLKGSRIQGPKECWSLEEGVLVGKSIASKQGSILWTEQKYKNFEFECEFRYTGNVDSGVFLRTENDQIQIGVSGSLKRDMTGSPYIAKTSKYPVEAKAKGLLKEGEWNRMAIKVIGAHYVVSLNGQQILDWESETAIEEGPVGLQVHGNLEMKIEFRNLVLRKLPSE
jgi:hypothetical protein